MRELKRQIWHAFSGTLLAFMIYYIGVPFFQGFAISAIIVLIFIKILLQRKYKLPIFSDFISVFGRKNELGDGSLYFFLGAFIASLFFEPLIAAVSVLVLGVSDAASTIFGFYFGKIKLYKSKTLTGSSAFFITCFLIVNFYYGFLTAIITAIILTPMELIGGFNDNIVIPPLCGLVIQLVPILL